LKLSPAKKKKKIKRAKYKVWKVLSAYIRIKYADKDGYVTCYTCGKKMYWKKMQAGHAIPGRANDILYDEEIIRPQCRRCNIMQQGNLHIFAVKIMEEKNKQGIDGLKWFKSKIYNRHSVNYSLKELHELIEKYKNLLVKEVKKRNINIEEVKTFLNMKIKV